MPLPFAAVLGASAIGKGLRGLFGNRAANAQAENARRMQDYRTSFGEGALKRRGSIIGSTLRKLFQHPEVYGKYFSPDMFGHLPGPLTEGSFELPRAPKLKGASGLGAFLGGAASGIGDVMGDRGLAERTLGSKITSPGQPVGRQLYGAAPTSRGVPGYLAREGPDVAGYAPDDFENLFG